MVPERRGGVVVRVLEGGLTGSPRHAEPRLGDGPEVLEPPSVVGIAVGDVGGVGQVPRLRVAVALLADAHRPVDVGHDRHRPGVCRVLGLGVGELAGRHVGQALEARRLVGPLPAFRVRALLRVGPVQRGVDGQEVGQVAALGVGEPVHPGDAHRRPVLGLDGHARCVEQHLSSADVLGPVAPHRRGRPARRQDLLVELAHRDAIDVHQVAVVSRSAGPWHRRWLDEGADELRHLTEREGRGSGRRHRRGPCTRCAGVERQDPRRREDEERSAADDRPGRLCHGCAPSARAHAPTWGQATTGVATPSGHSRRGRPIG